MNIIKNQNILRKVFVIFMCIYPLFSVKYFYNSYFTLLQLTIVLGFLFWTFLTGNLDKKNLKYIILYLLLLLLYAFMHEKNAQVFQSLIPGNFGYSRFSELLSIIKMSMPVFFVYLMGCLKIEKREVLKVVKAWIIIICGSIIVSNILKFSYGSYTDERIVGNFFEWLNLEYTYQQLASKGFFMYGNQITCILVSLLPFVMYFYFTNRLKVSYVISMMVTMLLLGTRVANLGSILVFVVMNAVYVFFVLIKKLTFDRKKMIYSFIILLIYLMILPFSPTSSRSEIYGYLLDEQVFYTEEDKEAYLPNASAEQKIEYISNNYVKKKINPEFILESYPYQYDPDFWYEILHLPEEMRANYRFLEISMVERNIEINNNPADKLWGITNTRIQNIFNIERDYILQYYAFGIVGAVLFLGVYFIILLKEGIGVLKDFNFYRVCHLAAVVLFMGIAYLSGNIFGQMAAFIPVLFLICPKRDPYTEVESESAPPESENVTKASKNQKVLTGVTMILLLLAEILHYSNQWIHRIWAELSMEELVYHLTTSFETLYKEFTLRYIRAAIIPTIIGFIVISFVLYCYRKKKCFKYLLVITGIVSVGVCAFSVYDAWERLDIGTYLKAYGKESSFVKEHYKDPEKVDVFWPEQKRNLVYIIPESMEITYADINSGGGQDVNVIPEITNLALQNEDFSSEEAVLNGAVDMPYSGWEMSSIIAQMAGMPMNCNERVFEDIKTVGDILEEAGYTQTLLVGENTLYDGRQKFFTDHGNYNIFDYEYMLETGRLDVNYKVWNGYEDVKLFEFAKEELQNLASQKQPFNLTIMTSDTHAENGYVCQNCFVGPGENQYSNVLKCSSEQIYEFVSWAKQQDFYDDTTIVIIGDHLTKDSDYCVNIDESYQRKIYVSYINAASEKILETERYYTLFDTFPTTLSALGFKIEGERLGLGTNLYSDEETLLEKMGLETMKAELRKKQ